MHGQIWVIYFLNSLFYIRIYKFIGEVTRQSRNTIEPPLPVELAPVSSAKKRTASKDSSVEKTVLILQYYPIILIVTWCPLTIMRIFEYMDFYIPCWVYAFSLGMSNMQGICNAVVFFSVSAKSFVDIIFVEQCDSSL